MDDFYCEEALSGKTPVKKIVETDNVLAFYHTKPHWKPVHIVVIPKKHISSFVTLTKDDNELFLELMDVVKKLAKKVTEEQGACRILTNLGNYQDSKHLHFHVASGEPQRKGEITAPLVSESQ